MQSLRCFIACSRSNFTALHSHFCRQMRLVSWPSCTHTHTHTQTLSHVGSFTICAPLPAMVCEHSPRCMLTPAHVTVYQALVPCKLNTLLCKEASCLELQNQSCLPAKPTQGSLNRFAMSDKATPLRRCMPLVLIQLLYPGISLQQAIKEVQAPTACTERHFCAWSWWPIGQASYSTIGCACTQRQCRH